VTDSLDWIPEEVRAALRDLPLGHTASFEVRDASNPRLMRRFTLTMTGMRIISKGRAALEARLR
jgi:hypothetical protein